MSEPLRIVLSDREKQLYTEDESYAQEKQTQAQDLANKTGQTVLIGHMLFDQMAIMLPTQDVE